MTNKIICEGLYNVHVDVGLPNEDKNDSAVESVHTNLRNLVIKIMKRYKAGNKISQNE